MSDFDKSMSLIAELVERFEQLEDHALKGDLQRYSAALLNVHRQALAVLTESVDKRRVSALGDNAALQTILELHALTLPRMLPVLP